jgi:hypothetical protein
MRKLATLLLAAAMLLGGVTGAEAIDWKVRGDWRFEFGIFDGLSFSKHTRGTQRDFGRNRQYGAGDDRDNFQAGQRIDLWLEAVASENLSGTLRLEIGGHRWGTAGTNGNKDSGGAMGQRGVSIGVRNAYLDWFVPQTELKIRMGIQPIATPGFAFGASVLSQDVAGITAAYKFNNNVSLTAFWVRPYNDNYVGETIPLDNDNTRRIGARDEAAAFMDNFDVFGLIVPLSFDGFKITPWGAIAAVGPNTFRGAATRLSNAEARDALGLANNNDGHWRNNFTSGRARAQVLSGLTPAYYQTNNRRAAEFNARGPRDYATAWWGGLTFDLTAVDPFRFAFDGVYGSITWPGAGYLNRSGWFLTALAEYKLNWGVPGIYGWWGSGDDGNAKNGSERMPIVDMQTAITSYSSFGLRGEKSVGNAISNTNFLGEQFHAGSWGIGVRIRDMSFLEDLSHTIRVNLFGGTNDPKMAKNMLGKRSRGIFEGGRRSDFNDGATNSPVYLTTRDYGIELNLDTVYKIYENLELLVELGYMHLWLDTSRGVWGNGNDAAGQNTIRGVSTTDALKAFMHFRYRF